MSPNVTPCPAINDDLTEGILYKSGSFYHFQVVDGGSLYTYIGDRWYCGETGASFVDQELFLFALVSCDEYEEIEISSDEDEY